MSKLILILLVLNSACSSLNYQNDFDKSKMSSFAVQNNKANIERDTNTNSWTTEKPPSMSEISEAIKNDSANDKLSSMGEWWLYGPGIGYSILNIGTVIVFPPYALYLVGNAALSLSGYEPLHVTNILPEEPKKIVNESLEGICSVPGRINSQIAGRPYVYQINLSENQ